MPALSTRGAASARGFGFGGALALPGDPLFNQVTMLLPGNGVNGAQNNTFVDSSSNNFTITRNGDATQGTFSPFAHPDGYWSNYFDGSGDSISTPTNAAFNGFGGSTSWQIDFWWWPISGAIQWDGPFDTVGNAGIFFRNRSGYLDFVNNGDYAGLIRSNYPSLHTWHHIVLVHDGATSQRSVFIDGVRTGTITNGNVFDNGSIGIGTPGVGTFNAYISDFRVIKGSRTYDPAATSITVPTSPSTAVSGTVLLTCQGNRFRDASSNNFSLTVGGNPSVQLLTPYNLASIKYSAGTNGGSGYFDGSGDYLNATLTGQSPGTGDLTFEFWVYRTSTQSCIISSTRSADTSDGLSIEISSSNQLVAGFAGDTFIVTAAGSVPLNAWSHCAIVRSSGYFQAYINGVAQISAVQRTTNFTSTTFNLGYWSVVAPYGTTYLTGYLSGYRYTKTAVYTSNFTPPTAPPTNVANTVLLLNFTNAGITDAAMTSDLVTVGNAQISTAVSKFGGGSLAFDGSGDAVVSAATPAFQLGTNWTIEGWFRTTSRTGDMRYITVEGSSYQVGLICGGGGSGGSTNDLVLNRFGSGDWIRASGVLTGTDGTWNHVAIVCALGTIKLYFNGVNVGGSSTNTMPAGNCFITVGASVNYSSYSYNGYQDDVRVTTGAARYLYNFTPPTRALPTYYGPAPAAPAADPYFENTVLLLSGDGTNGAQNNTFVDSSASPLTITRNGDTTQGTFSPFSQTGWSNYFGSGGASYLIANATDTSKFAFGTGDLTIEFFIYADALTAPSGFVCFYDQRAASTDAVCPTIYYYSGQLLVLVQSSNVIYGGSLSLNQWTHIALSRVSGNSRLFINGVQSGSTYSDSNNYVAPSSDIRIFANAYGGSRSPAGYCSNFRVVKGTGLYSANFTPPVAALTAISGTSLLTCQGNRFIDASSNGFAVTPYNSVSVQAFSPFNPAVEYSAATNGGSGYFDGSGDYLTSTNSSALDLGTGAFTIEFWIYGALNNDKFILGSRSALSGGLHITTGGVSSTAGCLRVATNAGTLTSGSVLITNSGWNHCAIVRNGTTLTLYVNGVSVASGTDATNFTGTTGTWYIGRHDLVDGNYLNAFLSDLRIVKGTAVYTANFTPPTAPLTAISGTGLLLNYTNAGIRDATGKNDLVTVGNAQISTAQSKFGGGSMLFDGNGDYLPIPNTPLLDLGSGDFTIEFWYYPIDTTSHGLFHNYNADFQGIAITGNEVSAGKIKILAGNGSWFVNLLSGGAATIGAWNHIAATRFGSTWTIWINGVSSGSVTNSSTASFTTDQATIGRFTSGIPYWTNAYLDDFRITKGIARYVQNFTPPTAAFQLR